MNDLLKTMGIPDRMAANTRSKRLSLHALRFSRSEESLAALAAATPGIPIGLARATQKRKLEFLAGRRCGMLALRMHGLAEPAEIPMGLDRAPIWPAGFVGSISHSGDLAAAVVGLRSDWIGLGMDVERLIAAERLESIGRQVLTHKETELGRRAGLSLMEWLTLVFSAKESLFKALFPSVGRYFDFLDAEVVSVSVPDHMLALSLRRPLGDAWPAGRILQVDFDWLLDAAITLCALREIPVGTISA